MIYSIWQVGDDLRTAGHFFVMTVRSSLLHMIGTGRSALGSCDLRQIDRDATVVIPLSSLSKTAVEAMVSREAPRVADQADAIRFIAYL